MTTYEEREYRGRHTRRAARQGLDRRCQEPGRLIELKGRGGLVVAFVLLTVAGCSSVSICLEQEKGVSASEDARSQGCQPNRPTR